MSNLRKDVSDLTAGSSLAQKVSGDSLYFCKIDNLKKCTKSEEITAILITQSRLG